MNTLTKITSFVAASLLLSVYSDNTLAGECANPLTTNSPCTITDDTRAELHLINTNAGIDDWEIESLDEAGGDVFQIGPRNSGTDVFKIKTGADENNLVLTAEGNVAINSDDTLGSNELEVFGNTNAADTFAAIAISPSSQTTESARFTVNGTSDTWSIGNKLSGTGYTNPVSSVLNAPNNSITIDAQGDVGINGIATGNIQSNLHVGGGDLFLDASGVVGDWTLDTGAIGFWLTNGATEPVKFQNSAPDNSLVVASSGLVGLGTDIPSTQLEVVGSSSSTRLRVQNTNGTDALRSMLSVANNGPVNVAFVDTSPGGTDWNFRGSQSGPFAISANGTGAVEFTVGLNTAGATFTGPVRATSFINTSTREAKEGFKDVDVREVLAKIVEVPVSTWKYKHDEKRIRHMGPMAEDFRHAFRLGVNNKTINTVDAAGVTIAAIQGLHQLMQDKDARIAKLESTQSEKDVKIAKLEQHVAELSAQQERVDALEQVVALLVSDQSQTLRHAALVQ